MFLKLFKYDLTALFKRLLFMYALVLITFMMTYAVDFFENANAFAFQLIYILLYAIFFIVIFITGFFSFILGIAYYYQSTYKDQGYLTNTLPISKMKIVASKMFANLVVYIVTILFTTIIILLKDGSLWEVIKDIMYIPADETIAEAILLRLIVVHILLGISCIYLSLVYLGISLGSSHSSKKAFYAILYSIGLCFLFTFISIFLLVSIAEPLDQFFSSFNFNFSLWQAYLLFLLILSVITIAIIGLVWGLTALNMKKRLNLE